MILEKKYINKKRDNMKKLKYVKLFDGFSVNEEIINLFSKSSKRSIDEDLNPNKTDITNLKIVSLGSNDYTSYSDIKEGDIFIDDSSFNALKNNDLDLAKKIWTVYRVESISDEKAYIQFIYHRGSNWLKPETATAKVYGRKPILDLDYDIWFNHKIQI